MRSLESPVPQLDLNLLMLFLEIVNAGSISQAATRLATPKATLSRKLRQLEQQVGAVLLKRGPHRLELTEIGQALLQHCQRIAAEAADASVVASEMQSQLRGTMRICIPFGLASTWISAALARFALEYPDVRLTIHVTNSWVDVSEEPYDVAIYIGRVRNEHLPVRRLAELPRGIYASPKYCERRGSPKRPEELLQHDCIALESQLQDKLWTFDAPDGGRSVTVTPRMTVSDIIAAREMAVAGIGFAMLTHAVCESEVQSGRLVRVLPDWHIPPVAISATFLERRHMPLRIRAFIDMLAQAIDMH
ncbi:MAG TPA: LysR family transcriptional regulator [Steroidobacteraceae bacterium]|nr:LysR family transcriptional regulator [Steroidobacteraceae bacterium]